MREALIAIGVLVGFYVVLIVLPLIIGAGRATDWGRWSWP